MRVLPVRVAGERDRDRGVQRAPRRDLRVEPLAALALLGGLGRATAAAVRAALARGEREALGRDRLALRGGALGVTEARRERGGRSAVATGSRSPAGPAGGVNVAGTPRGGVTVREAARGSVAATIRPIGGANATGARP